MEINVEQMKIKKRRLRIGTQELFKCMIELCKGLEIINQK